MSREFSDLGRKAAYEERVSQAASEPSNRPPSSQSRSTKGVRFDLTFEDPRRVNSPPSRRVTRSSVREGLASLGSSDGESTEFPPELNRENRKRRLVQIPEPTKPPNLRPYSGHSDLTRAEYSFQVLGREKRYPVPPVIRHLLSTCRPYRAFSSRPPTESSPSLPPAVNSPLPQSSPSLPPPFDSPLPNSSPYWSIYGRPLTDSSPLNRKSQGSLHDRRGISNLDGHDSPCQSPSTSETSESDSGFANMVGKKSGKALLREEGMQNPPLL